MGMEAYSDGTSKTSPDDQLEYTQIEGLVDVNNEDDNVFNRCQAGGRLVKCPF
jgi:hypothetical protein